MRTAICDLLGIDIPLVAFSHCRDVVAAVTNAGGFGVLGASSHTPEQLEHELAWIDDHVDGRPYGADIIVPERFEGKGQRLAPEAMAARVPRQHRDFVRRLLAERGVELGADELDRPRRSLVSDGAPRCRCCRRYSGPATAGPWRSPSCSASPCSRRWRAGHR
jgi:hypothetical protein